MAANCGAPSYREATHGAARAGCRSPLRTGYVPGAAPPRSLAETLAAAAAAPLLAQYASHTARPRPQSAPLSRAWAPSAAAAGDAVHGATEAAVAVTVAAQRPRSAFARRTADDAGLAAAAAAAMRHRRPASALPSGHGTAMTLHVVVATAEGDPSGARLRHVQPAREQLHGVGAASRWSTSSVIVPRGARGVLRLCM